MRNYSALGVGSFFSAALLVVAALSAQAATFTVSNTNDAGLGSLRDAINQANANAGADTVAFAIPGTGPHTIKLSSILPAITNAATAIRGDTQTGYSNTPVVQVLGPVGAPNIGLRIQTGSVTVRAVRVTGFGYAGITSDIGTGNVIQGCLVDSNVYGIGVGIATTIGGSNVALRNVIINNISNGIYAAFGNGSSILGNYIGVAADGVTPAGNGDYGIRLWQSDNNQIYGGSNFPQVISSCAVAGIYCEPNGSYTVSSGNNQIYGNLIGTDASGTNVIPNGTGINIFGGVANVIGGTTAAKRNVIVGSSSAGIHIHGLHYGGDDGSGNAVIGNYIGLAADGETVLSNYVGVSVYETENNRVGGTAAGEGNRFGRATYYNVRIFNNYSFSQLNTVQGNWFGISVSTQLLAAGGAGVQIGNSSNNLIGGTTTNARNYFGGANSGLWIVGPGSQHNRVIGNWIGVGPGAVQMGNDSYGVSIDDAPNNQIGGVATNEGNVISGNQYYGVGIAGTGAYGNVVAGNIIGLDPTGSFSISNRYSGVDVSDGAYSNRIGGTNAATMNIIAGNGSAGVSIRNFPTYGNLVVGNLVGLNLSGTRLPNDGYGVDIFNSSRNQVGGVYTNQGNVLSGNQWNGIFIRGTGSYANVVEGNIIGLDPTSTFVVSNRYAGVDIAGGTYSNRIGGTNAATMNVICGNGNQGVIIREPATYGNVVLRNFIGMSRTNASFGNKGAGIEVNQSPTNTIGPGNYVGDNSREGVYLVGTSTVNNVIFGNIIGQDVNGIAHPNAYGGIGLNGAPNNRIGLNGAGNYVAGNSGDGISVDAGSTNVVVRGNIVGLQLPGLTTPLANGYYGISVSASDVIVGGTNAGDVNVVSGNEVHGIHVNVGGTNAHVLGNIVGLDPTGAFSISNKFGGVAIDASGVVLGGRVPSARNLISGNRGDGVIISATASNVLVINNYIGVDGSGTSARRNVGAGISIEGTGITIGGTNAQEANLISGNVNVGIDIYTGSNIRVVGNVIGLGSDGVTNLPNGAGIWIYGRAANVTIGGTNANERNVIARNTGNEVEIVGPSGGNRVIGNFIGVQNFGVAFATGANNDNAILVNSSPNNQILNNVVGQENIGIQLNGAGTYNTLVQGNYIGEYSLESISNLSWGIQIINSSSNRIGGSAVAERNLIANNLGGIAVTNTVGNAALANLIAVNLIYSNGTRLNIELGPNGYNTNDALDADAGANRLQNRPTLTNAITLFPGLSSVYAQGVLTSAPLTTFAVDIYRSGGTNAEGRAYLGRVPVATDINGYGTFSAGFAISMGTGTYLTATATDPEGNTSEFAVAPTGTIFKSSADGDGDLIPDYWETLYGLNPGNSNAANSDLDGDGVSDLSEYIADTPANDPTKFLKVIELAGTAPRAITFPSSPLRRYELQYSTNLTTNLWTTLGGTITGAVPQTTITDTNQPPLRHYRIGAKLP